MMNNTTTNQEKVLAEDTLEGRPPSEIIGDKSSLEKDIPRPRFCLARTPPRGRTHSLSDIDNSSGKRKRVEFSPKEDKDLLVQNGELLKETISMLSGQIAMFEGALLGSYKPKKELVEICTNLGREIKKLRSQNFETWLETALRKEDEHELENEELRRKLRLMQELQQENQRLSMELKNVKEAKMNDFVEFFRKTANVECPRCEQLRCLAGKRKEVKKEETFENFQEISEDHWGSEIFPALQEENKPIWEAPYEEDIILPCNKNLESKNKMINSAINRFGGKDGLLKQNKTKGEVAMMTQMLGFPSTQGNQIGVSRNIYYPLISEGLAWENVDDSVMYRALVDLKEAIIQNDGKMIAIPDVEGITGTIFERMIRYLFCDVKVSIKIYKIEKNTNKNKQTPKTMTITENDTKKEGKVSSKRPTKNRGDALLVQMEGKTYADLLKLVKQTVNPKEIGVDVKKTLKTKNGELLVRIGNGPDKAMALKSQLQDKIPGLSTSVLKREKIIHLKGMEETTTEGEIKEAVAEAVSVEPDSFHVSALRPAYGNSLNATIKMNEDKALKLLQLGAIKIGWSLCKIRERKEYVKCFKCWENGHTKAECKGPDRENMCMKCAKIGHKAASCPNTAFCVYCNSEGHQTGSVRCLKNKKHNDENPTN